MERLVHSEKNSQILNTLPADLELLRLEAEFKDELAHLRKGKLNPRPEAIANILHAFREKAVL
jgi:hypothetical protein